MYLLILLLAVAARSISLFCRVGHAVVFLGGRGQMVGGGNPKQGCRTNATATKCRNQIGQSQSLQFARKVARQQYQGFAPV
jgi:hypothetical protein